MKKLNQRDAVKYIATREEFKASSLMGTFAHIGAGQLEGKDLATYQADRIGINYIVYSYGTPIAWHTLSFGWYIVEQKFSVTTSKHQNTVRRATAESRRTELAGVI
jgi:hypothetical protein